MKMQMAEPTTTRRPGDLAEKGQAFYEKIKVQYEPQYKGKFLAIDPEAERIYMADTFNGACDLAHAENPHTSFYLLRIGYPAVGTMASVFSN